MNRLFSVFGTYAVAFLSGCVTMPVADTETAPLKCGESKSTIYQIPIVRQPIPVDLHFKMSCEGGQKGIEFGMENHPWGGFGKTMPRSIGDDAPRYEYIPCPINGVFSNDLQKKWNDLNNYEHFSNIGRDIQDIRSIPLEARVREDYNLRLSVLQSAKNLCLAGS
jgi:hypothetical protein